MLAGDGSLSVLSRGVFCGGGGVAGCFMKAELRCPCGGAFGRLLVDLSGPSADSVADGDELLAV